MAYIDLLKLTQDYATLKISGKKFYNIMKDYPEQYFKLTAKINAAEKLRHKIISDRNLEVVYITGTSGSGKTTAAKYFATKLNYDFFVSGSGEDILDGYDKEECIILDDFRGGTMKFSELLKFLDNNTNSSVKSRYNNKDVSNCKLIIITSVYPPDNLYAFLNKDKEDKEEVFEEPIEQLYRRLKHHYFDIDAGSKEIREFKLIVGSTPIMTNKTLGTIDNIYKELGIDPTKVDDTSILDAFKVDSKEPLIY